MTAVTGRDAGDHLVPGFAYYVGSAARVVTPLVRSTARSGGDDLPGDAAARLPTVFDRARAHGISSVALTGALDDWRGPWLDRLLAGARRQAPSAVTGDDPEAAATIAARDVTAVAELARRRREPTVIWCYVDLDSYVHRHGYDARARRAAATIDACARRLAVDGVAVLGHADHGLVRSTPDPGMVRAWRILEASALVRASGGAGRVRWLHGYPDRVAELRARATDIVEDAGLVVHREQLEAMGFLRLTPGLSPRIGDVVAIATQPRFPAFDAQFAFDHGSWTRGEREVLLAAWGDAGERAGIAAADARPVAR
jgi:hypothetical protein